MINKDNSILLKIKRLQENVNKIQKSTTADKIPEFTITSQNPKKINMPVKLVEEKIDNVKKNLEEHKMEYNIVEDIKGIRQVSHYLKCVMCPSIKKNC